jgi:serine/threonine-protein kinase ULK/ATG1
MHRDLKPDNIFFNAGVVKLGDFGFCKSLEKANMTKTMLGSPIYMAPEILRG